MALTRVENYNNFWIEKTPELEPYLTEGFMDMSSGIYKEENRSKPLKDFVLVVRVSKVVDGKQKFKKKKFAYTIKEKTTLFQALKNLADVPEQLLSKIVSDAEANKIAAAIKVKHAQADELEKVNRILNDAWDDFYKTKTQGAGKKWRDSTANTYKSFYNVWIRDTELGYTPVKSITKQSVKNLIDEVAEIRMLRTATTVIEVLRPMLDWYFDEYEIDKRNPVPSKKEYPFDNVRVIDIELPEIKKLYDAMDAHEHSNIFKWLRTGRRRGEVVGLTAEHIDLSGSSFLVTADTNKAKIDMEYKLRDELRETISVDSGKLFDVYKDTISDSFKEVVTGLNGTFKLRGKRCPLSDLHLHDLRHLISGVLKKASVPEEIRAKVLGHKRSSITDRYGANYYEDIDEAYQLFLDIVYGVKPEATKWGAA